MWELAPPLPKILSQGQVASRVKAEWAVRCALSAHSSSISSSLDICHLLVSSASKLSDSRSPGVCLGGHHVGFLAPTTLLGKVGRQPGFKPLTPGSRCSIRIGPSAHPLFWFPHCPSSTSNSIFKLLTPSPLSFRSEGEELPSAPLVLGRRDKDEETRRCVLMPHLPTLSYNLSLWRRSICHSTFIPSFPPCMSRDAFYAS